jgi:hypothetical protein
MGASVGALARQFVCAEIAATRSAVRDSCEIETARDGVRGDLDGRRSRSTMPQQPLGGHRWRPAREIHTRGVVPAHGGALQTGTTTPERPVGAGSSWRGRTPCRHRPISTSGRFSPQSWTSTAGSLARRALPSRRRPLSSCPQTHRTIRDPAFLVSNRLSSLALTNATARVLAQLCGSTIWPAVSTGQPASRFPPA